MSAENRERDQKLADWSADKVAAALPELTEELTERIWSACSKVADARAICMAVREAIARYGEAVEAAARLAGRLEQAEKSSAEYDRTGGSARMERWLDEERDRLRREAGK